MNRLSESDLTLRYYDENAAAFCARTVDVDMSALRSAFLAFIRPGGRILDAGCGSGRDSLAFIQRGYDVVSIDGSAAMVEAASKLTGKPALLMRFDQMDFRAEFDGIWACASLLHVARREMPATFDRFERSLKPGGVWFMSFKAGEDQVVRDGCLFTNYTEQMLRILMDSRGALEASRLWTTTDARTDHPGEQWTNMLIRRRP